jgi:predicted nucleic acid-binding protein
MEGQTEVGAVADSSSIIILAKLNELDTMYAVCGLVGLTDAVFREVVIEGKSGGKDDALTVEGAIKRGFITRVTMTSEQEKLARALHVDVPACGLAECEAIAYAESKGILLLIEERKGRNLARARGVQYTIVQLLPLKGYIEGKISRDKCDELLDRIAIAMNTDIALLNGLKAAVAAIEQERRR